jgi:hypothetical protein
MPGGYPAGPFSSRIAGPRPGVGRMSSRNPPRPARRRFGSANRSIARICHGTTRTRRGTSPIPTRCWPSPTSPSPGQAAGHPGHQQPEGQPLEQALPAGPGRFRPPLRRRRFPSSLGRGSGFSFLTSPGPPPILVGLFTRCPKSRCSLNPPYSAPPPRPPSGAWGGGAPSRCSRSFSLASLASCLFRLRSFFSPLPHRKTGRSL